MPFRPGAGRKKTAVSKLFKEVTSKTGKLARVKCTFCSYELSKSGTRMTKHIVSCKKCPDEVKVKYITSSVSPSATASIASSVGNKRGIKAIPTTSQPHLKSFIDNISPEDIEKANELLARAIYASGSSLRIVENRFWLEYISFLRPAYKVPTRYEISGPLLNKEYEAVSALVNEQIAVAESVAIMCDGWTNVRNEPIVNFVVTTPSPMLYKILSTGKESHTAEYISKEVNCIIEKIGAQKVFGVVTDNAANMKAAWTLLKDKNASTNLFTYGCVAHGLNLLFTDLKDLNTLKSFLAKVVSAIKSIKRSHKLTEIFKEKQVQDNPMSLKLPVKTRWGSIVHCLDSFYQNKQAIKLLVVDEETNLILKKHPILKQVALDESFWDTAKGFLELLKPIAIAITSIESDKPQISQVIGIFKKLELHFQKVLPCCPLTKAEKKQAYEIFTHRKEFSISDVHKASCLLDPVLQGVDLTPDEQVNISIALFFG